MFQSFQTHEDIVFKYQNAFVLIFLLYFKGDVLVQDLIESLVDETECALAKLLLLVESLRNFEGVFELLADLVLGGNWQHWGVLHRWLRWDWRRVMLWHLVILIRSSSLS